MIMYAGIALHIKKSLCLSDKEIYDPQSIEV